MATALIVVDAAVDGSDILVYFRRIWFRLHRLADAEPLHIHLECAAVVSSGAKDVTHGYVSAYADFHDLGGTVISRLVTQVHVD